MCFRLPEYFGDTADQSALCNPRHRGALRLNETVSGMNSPFHLAAEDTARILQEAAHAGVTVMIPGAFEPRPGDSSTRGAKPAAPVPPHVQTVVMPDWQRLEYEREGGGAPSERPVGVRPCSQG